MAGPQRKASQNNLGRRRQGRKVKTASKDRKAEHLAGLQEETINNKLVKGRQEKKVKKELRWINQVC